jgi:hypothetical protein
MSGDSDVTEMAKRMASRPNAAAGSKVNARDNANQEASGLSLFGSKTMTSVVYRLCLRYGLEK